MSGLAQVCLAVFLLGFVGWSVPWKSVIRWLNHEDE